MRADTEILVRALLQNRERHGCGWVHFTDQAVPPRTLRELARGLRRAGLRWYGFARPEPALLDPRLAEELAESGCAMLQLGVETPSQRLLDLLGKGIRADHLPAILRNLHRAGIRTYVYLLFGVPSERAEEARRSLTWIEENHLWITFLNLALMNLPRGSDLEARPERYGIVLPSDDPGPDLSLYRPFAGAAGWNRGQARQLLARARQEPGPVREILARTPPGFTSNHAAFAPLP